MERKDRVRVDIFSIWVWRRMERMKWFDRMSNEEVLVRVKETIFNYIPKEKRKPGGTY